MKQTVIQNPTWWKRRTSLERKLLVLALMIVIFAAAVTVAAVTLLLQNNFTFTKDQELNASKAEAVRFCEHRRSKSEKHLRNATNTICNTPGCVLAASKIIENLDESIDPCDDFYTFSCGNFIKTHIIPDDKTSLTGFSLIADRLHEQLRIILEEPITETEPKCYQQAKNLYKACMNKKGIEDRGLQPLHDMIKKLGGWPVLEGDQWNEGDFDWKQAVYKFREQGYSVDYFIDFSIGVDLKNSTARTIDVDQATLGLVREYLIKGIDDKIVKAYYDYQVDLAVLLGADRKRAKKELKESLLFEIQLAEISLPAEQRRNASLLFNPMTIAEMQQKFPSIPWLEYFNNILPKNVQVSQDERVIVDVPSYIKSLENLLSHTPKRVQANYVIERAVAASVSYMTEHLRKRQLQYGTVLSGKTEREARWKECVDITSNGVSLAVGSLYVKRYFKEDAKKTALEMVNGIRAEFNRILRELDWMDENTRKQALQKAAAMSTHIAYPDELMDTQKLEEHYEGLVIDPELYLESVLKLTKFGTEFSFGRLRTPVNKTEWITHGKPAVVNAFYSGIENSIQFPAGILQGHFFSNDRPKYLNYGAIGFVIGHEITHGFDDQGRQFDLNGNLVDWWAGSTNDKFLKKAECIIHQYGNYTADEVGLNLNGINTQGENIADNGGVKEAYRAYDEWAKQHGEELALPGLPYTPRQLFWMSAANTWCSKYRPEALKLRIVTGVHSPGQFRVVGPLSNMEDFARDWNCPLGSKMNPVKKCIVW